MFCVWSYVEEEDSIGVGFGFGRLHGRQQGTTHLHHTAHTQTRHVSGAECVEWLSVVCVVLTAACAACSCLAQASHTSEDASTGCHTEHQPNPQRDLDSGCCGVVCVMWHL